MNIPEITSETFQKEVLEKDRVLVDFNAEWCGPCRLQAPILEELAKDGYKVASVNIDDEPDLADKYEVSSIPCLVLFEKGEEITRKIGLTPKKSLEKLLKED